MARDALEDEVFGLRRTVIHEIGQSLDALSLADLDERVALLRVEIGRLEAAKDAKEAAKSAAGSVFKF